MNSISRKLLGTLVQQAVKQTVKKDKQLQKSFWLAAGGIGALLATRALVRRATAYDLRGKTVLITGGSRGLGLVLAREFVRAGSRVALCARDAAELARAEADLQREGGIVITEVCDVTDLSQLVTTLENVHRQFGHIDVLVNNAGIINVGPLEEMRLADYEEAMATNFWGALYAANAVLPEMRARRSGRIVNIVSIGGKLSVPHLLPYSASKFALAGLSAGMRAELKKDGIIVTTVYPGLMRTGSPRNATFKGQHRAEYAWFSISDALPVTSISAESAARQILTACRHGEAEVVLSWQAKVAAKMAALFPGMTADLLGQVNRLLPGPGGIGADSATGEESRSTLAPSWLTKLSDDAAVRNNQL